MSIEITSATQVPAVGSEYAVSAGTATETEFSEVLKASKTTDLDAIFDAASSMYDIPVQLLKAVAKAESNYRADATSKCGAMGIMQLMPGTAKLLGVTDAYDPEQNIMGGAKYLRQMLDKFGGDTELALAAYNAGPGAVTKYDGIPPYKETQNYVKTVMGYYDGDELSAGSVKSRISSGGSLTLALLSGGRLRDDGAESEAAETQLLKDAIVESFMMRMLDLQMKSSDDEDRKIF